MAPSSDLQSALNPRGREADLIHELSTVLFVGGAVIFALVLVFLVVALGVRRRDAERPPRDRGHGRGKIRAVVTAALASAAVLVALLIYEFGLTRSLVAHAGDALPLRVVAHQWWWEVIYLDDSSQIVARTANEIHIPVGRPVAIELESRDVIHSFWVPNLQGKVDAIPGRTNRVVLSANEPGTYRGQCAEFCGLQHANMALYVVAEPPAQFHAWLEHQRSSAVAPADELAVEGQRVFMNAPCALCHTVRGTLAMASAGPDLTHLASRESLASGVLANTRGNLAAWFMDPQHTKPGTHMPATHLDSASADALLHYLQTLK